MLELHTFSLMKPLFIRFWSIYGKYIYSEQSLNTLFKKLPLKNKPTVQLSKDKSFKMKERDEFHNSFYSFGASCGAGNFSQDGSTPQISLAYSEIVLSLENLPDEAIFIMAIFVHSSVFVNMSLTLSWHLI